MESENRSREIRHGEDGDNVQEGAGQTTADPEEGMQLIFVQGRDPVLAWAGRLEGAESVAVPVMRARESAALVRNYTLPLSLCPGPGASARAGRAFGPTVTSPLI